MPIDRDLALERVLSQGDEWQSWRATRLTGGETSEPTPTHQDDLGGFRGPSGRLSPGATGLELCHLVLIGLRSAAPTTIAGDWLLEARTPAQAWLDAPDDVPGELDNIAGGRVWATAAAACGLLSVGRDPGHRAIDLLRGEADMEGRFTGGAYPTFAAAGVYWMAEGSKTEMAEWALRWARDWQDDWWGAAEQVSALTFWWAAGIPPEHASVELFLEDLSAGAPSEGFTDDLELTLRALEVLHYFGQ
jgi:hypothetical protein